MLLRSDNLDDFAGVFDESKTIADSLAAPERDKPLHHLFSRGEGFNRFRDDGVTLARSGFHLRAVENRHRPAPCFDHSRLTQSPTASLEGTDVIVSGNDWITYLEDRDQLNNLLARLLGR